EEGGLASGEANAEGLRPVCDSFVADPLEDPDRRDVERVLEGLPDEDRPALELIRIVRGATAPAAELGGDVEEQAAWGQLLRVERRRVEDRLPGRSRLAGAVTCGVVFRLELAAREIVAVVARAAGVGEHVSGSIVDRDERAVVKVLAAQSGDPAPAALRDPELGEQLRRRLGGQARGDRARREPALRLLLTRP